MADAHVAWLAHGFHFALRWKWKIKLIALPDWLWVPGKNEMLYQGGEVKAGRREVTSESGDYFREGRLHQGEGRLHQGVEAWSGFEQQWLQDDFSRPKQLWGRPTLTIWASDHLNNFLETPWMESWWEQPYLFQLYQQHLVGVAGKVNSRLSLINLQIVDNMMIALFYVCGNILTISLPYQSLQTCPWTWLEQK